MKEKYKSRPFMTYGNYILAADSRQWIVALIGDDVDEDGDPEMKPNSETYHKDLKTALRRLADRKVRNQTIRSLDELRDAFDRVGEEMLDALSDSAINSAVTGPN